MLSPEERLDPKQTALIVVDVQNDFCHPDGACAQSFHATLTHIHAAMPTLHKLIDGARRAGVFIVFIRSIYDDQYLTPAIRDQAERRGATRLCQTGEWGSEFYGGVGQQPQRGEIVVVKHRFNAFFETELDAELRKRDINRVICSGFTTSVCVESTARDAFFHGYHTMIASDAVAEFDKEHHDSTLKLFNRSFGVVFTVDEILNVWSQRRATGKVPLAASA